MKTCTACSIKYPDAVEFCPRDGTPLPPNPATQALYDPLIGSTIDGRYIVEAILGQGGMGFVYAARHAIIDKRVAIKVLRKEHSQDKSAVERFLVEAKAASKIGHQNIVDITDFGVLPGQAGGHAYFVMEFLDGPTLGRVMHESGTVTPKRAIAVTVQIARGLQAAHDKGIIHRDLKPENIFVLERDGQNDVVKIVDFGIARDTSHKKRLTQAGMVLGTPEYMSPEQATGQPTDHRVDMYALGCILYEMLTGDVPFKADNPTKTLTMHVFDKVVPPSVKRPDLQIPASLEAVVLKTIQKKPDDRYANLREMMAELDRVDAELRGARSAMMARPVAAPLPQPAPSSTDTNSLDELPRAPGRMAAIVAVCAGVVVLMVAAGIAVSHKSKTPPADPAAGTGAVAPPSIAPPPIAPPPIAPPPAEAELVLRSDPPGAEVFDGAERLGVAPATLHRPRGTAPLVFTLKKAGFQDARREVVPDRDRDVEVVLVARRTHLAADPRRGAPAPHAPAPVAHGPTAPAPPPNAVRKPQSDLRNPFE